MKIKKGIIFILSIFSISLISFVVIRKNHVSYDHLKSNSNRIDLPSVDSFQLFINEYCKLNRSIDSLGNLIEFERKSDSENIKRIEKLNSDILNDRVLKTNTIGRSLNDSLKKLTIAHYDSLIDFSNRKISILKKLIYGKEVDKLEKEKDSRYSALKSVINNLKIWSTAMTGSRAIVFNEVKYHLFVADLDSNMVKMHLINVKSKNSLENVKTYLELQRIKPLMITNAGMFTPTYEPEGLYIEENPAKKYNLDVGDQKSNLNFYLKPNGVFYLDNKNIPHIDSTQEIARLQRYGKLKVKLATQSGPMLVINGRIHPAFVKGSSNRKIRSGVGIINTKKIVFAATLDGSNFYDFAVFLRDIYQCKNALFLDGAISKMYLHDIDSTETGGQFGPIISVSKKNKK